MIVTVDLRVRLPAIDFGLCLIVVIVLAILMAWMSKGRAVLAVGVGLRYERCDVGQDDLEQNDDNGL